MSESGHKSIVVSVIAYLMAVKDTFKDNSRKFNEFLVVMKDYRARSIDVEIVATRMKEILKGHRDLILGFNNFLPIGHEISLPPEDVQTLQEKSNLSFVNALNFIRKVKVRFQDKAHIYYSFAEILKMYRKGEKSVTEIYQQVIVLFEGHTDLLLEFTKFLPDV